jgi:ABC-type lipoprotein release transport system permease subunit
VSPSEWLSTAYYENDWFSGSDVVSAMQQLDAENDTIILQKSFADNLNLDINDFLAVRLGSITRLLKVVGYFGSEKSAILPVLEMDGLVYDTSWSYVSLGLYQSIVGDVPALGRLLVRLSPGIASIDVANQIRDLKIGQVYSTAEQLESWETNLIRAGPTNVQRIGVLFSVIAASLATALVTAVGLQERKKELSIMNARGLSNRQLLAILLAENLAIMIFAIALGAIVGLVIVHGSITSFNTEYSTFLLRRMIFPIEAVMTLVASMLLVLISSIIPTIVITRRYTSRLERIVRT